MRISGPEPKWSNRRDYEVTLERSMVGGGYDTICTDRSDFYASWFKKKMRENKYCSNFPNLLGRNIQAKRPPPLSSYPELAGDPTGKPIPEGIPRCELYQDGGLTRKLITYHAGGTTYAINGTARNTAGSKGWVDGVMQFTPLQMQNLLAKGLSGC